ncbi:MAG: DMT family transporter [Gemmobacter sp.]
MRPLRGILYKIASVLVFTVLAVLVKATSGTFPPGQQVFFRSLFALPVIVVWLMVQGDLRAGLRTENPLGHLWRGLVGVSAMGLGFAGLGLLPLPEVTAIGYAAPLLTVIFAAMFLGEQVRAFRMTAVALGLVGVLIVLSPRLSIGADVTDREAFGAMVVLSGAVFAALAQVFVRKLVQVETTSAIVFWFSLTATLLSLVTLPFGWVWPTPGEAGVMVLLGLLGGIGQIFLTQSYREAPASVVAPFDYVSMIFALGFGFFLFAEVPTLTMLLGAAIIVAAGIIIIWRERQLGLERARQRKAMTPQG